ncbi:ABC transporter permease subunit [Rhizobium sp. BK251]|uniref:ABC transporter permease n=1 Tax=Rhizobium sp. BK251 TaxID=2512125 RepID=UPI001050AF6A|nr:ABC transporter permease subunit [Rhizobium sp. BK251]TCL69437.1 ABC-type Fe3+ transport system permease subunit [Rhizobium sp. BK251]
MTVSLMIRRQRWGGGAPILWLLAFVLIGLPLLLVLGQAAFPRLFDPVAPSFEPTLGALSRLVSSPRLLNGVVNTVLLGIVGAVTSTALGTVLALVLTVTDIRLRKLWLALPWLVFATPSYLKGLAWVLLMSQGGYLVYLGVLSPERASAFFGPPGLLMVMAFALFPVPYFIVRSRLQGLGGEFIDAARMASARPWQTIRRIVAPMLLPAIGLSLLTTFAEIVGDFGMANTIARSMNFSLLTYNIYAATASFPVDFAAAGAQALLLVVLVSGSVVAAALGGAQKETRFVSGRNRRLVRYGLGKWQPIALGCMIIFALGAAILPLLAIVVRAFTVSLSDALSPDNFSLAAMRTVFDISSAAGQALVWSFVYAFLAAVVAVTFAIMFAYRISLASRTTRLVSAGLAMVTVAIPGIILAFGYILVYNRLFGFRDLGLYGSRTLLVIGYAAAALPYCLIFLWAALDRLGPSLGEAARLSGAGPMQHLRRVVMPLTRRAIVVAFGVTMVRSVFELPMSQFLMPRSGPALPALIVNDFTQDRDAVACAMALVALVVVGVVAGIALLFRKCKLMETAS